MIRIRKYPEFTEDEETLVQKVARQMIGHCGLTDDDLDDLEQELAICLWQNKGKYDAGHQSESSYKTFISRILNKRRFDMLRERDTHKRRANWHCTSLSERQAEQAERFGYYDIDPDNEIANEISEETGLTVDEYVALRDELGEFLERLPSEQQTLCEMLSEGFSPSEIAEELRIPRSTIYSQILAIRKQMEEEEIGDLIF